MKGQRVIRKSIVWTAGLVLAAAGCAGPPAGSEPEGVEDDVDEMSAAVGINVAPIKQVYIDTLGREPSDWEVNVWLYNLESGGWTLERMRAAFVEDPQCRTAIAAVYQGTLERTPDTWEVDVWQQNIRYGWTIPRMREAFTQSEECKGKIAASFLNVVHLVARPGDVATGQAKLATGNYTLATYRAWLSRQLRYNQVYQRSIHNAYEMGKAAGVIDQLVYYGVRDFEWDLRSQPISNVCGLEHHPANDWYVYHSPWQPSDYGRFGELSDGLRLLAAFHAAVPEHEVVTLHLELKGGNDGGSCDVAFPDPAANAAHDAGHQTPEGLDARLRALLGSALFTPGDLLALCPGAGSLQQAVATCGWPLLDSLRGKVIVTLHAGNWNEVTTTEDSYDLYAGPNSSAALGRTAFLAPLRFVNSWPYEPPSFGGLANNPNVVMHTEGGALWAVQKLLQDFPGAIVRAPGTNDWATFYNDATSGLYPWIQTDRFDWHADGFARTENAFGYPFCPLGVVGPDCQGGAHALSNARERRHLLEMTVRSGDIWGTADDFAFAPSWVVQPAQRNSWAAFISDASNGNVHHWAKGCLMARYDFTRESPYFAVCRAGDEEELFVQYRTFGCSGPCGTARVAASLGHGIRGEEATFVKMDVWPAGGGGSFAQGYASVDGATWHPLGEPVYFQQELGLQGLAASSNDPSKSNADGTPTRFLFGNVKRNGNRQTFGGTPMRYKEGGVIKTAEPLSGAVSVGNVVSRSHADLSYYGEL